MSTNLIEQLKTNGFHVNQNADSTEASVHWHGQALIKLYRYDRRSEWRSAHIRQVSIEKLLSIAKEYDRREHECRSLRTGIERENQYVSYYTVTPRKGYGYLVEAFNGQQAVAKVIHHYRIRDRYLCVNQW